MQITKSVSKIIDNDMKQIFEQYSLYDTWANQRMIEVIAVLPEETVKKTVASSFSSLYLTLLHIWNTESIWWQRIRLIENVEMPGNENNSIQEIASGLIMQSKQWHEWIEKSSSAAFEHEFIYRNSKKEQFKQPVYQVLLHLFNHGTYHRGQLVTILRQLEITTIPSTDFIEWSRRK